MKLVRIATPGMVRRMRSISFRKISPDAPRFMRFSTGALACCSGMSMYFTSAAMRGDRIEQFLRDLVRIRVEEADPLLVRRFDLRQARQQQRQAVLQPEIFAVAGGVLPDQVDLAHALLRTGAWLPRSPIRSAGCGTCRDTAESRRRCRDDRSPRRS